MDSLLRYVEASLTETPIGISLFRKFGDGNSSTDVNPVHAYSDTGIYEVALRAISDFGGSENLIFRELKIENPSSKFVGRYAAKLNQTDYLLRIASGNSPSTILLFLNDVLFCNATCRLQAIQIDQQNFWTSEYSLLLNGVGSIAVDHLELDLLVEDADGNEHLLSLSAERLTL